MVGWDSLKFFESKPISFRGLTLLVLSSERESHLNPTNMYSLSAEAFTCAPMLAIQG